MCVVANHCVRTLSLTEFQPDILHSAQIQSISDINWEQHSINTNLRMKGLPYWHIQWLALGRPGTLLILYPMERNQHFQEVKTHLCQMLRSRNYKNDSLEHTPPFWGMHCCQRKSFFLFLRGVGVNRCWLPEYRKDWYEQNRMKRWLKKSLKDWVRSFLPFLLVNL